MHVGRATASTVMWPPPAPSHLATYGGEVHMNINYSSRPGERSRFSALELKQKWLRCVRAALPPSPRGCGPSNTAHKKVTCYLVHPHYDVCTMVNALPLPSHQQRDFSSSFHLKTYQTYFKTKGIAQKNNEEQKHIPGRGGPGE